MNDVIIIGTGIVGSLVAYELSKYNLSILVLDKDNDPCNQTSISNSGIIHTGYDPEDNTNKLKYNLLGAKLYPDLCKILDVPYQKVGSLIINNDPDKSNQLDKIYQQAKSRAIEVERLNQHQLFIQEPNLNKDNIEALRFKDTAIISPVLICLRALETSILNGVVFKPNQEVTKIKKHDDYYEVKCHDHEYQARYLINCAGVNALNIYKLIDHKYDHHDLTTKGSYFVFNKRYQPTKQVIFMMPTPQSKGVLAIPTVEGNLMIGPDAIACTNKDEDHNALNQIKEQAKMIFDDIDYSQVIHKFAGLRAKTTLNDFVVGEINYPNFINCLNIDSPGLASAPAIAKEIVSLISSKQSLKPKPEFKLLPKRIETSKLDHNQLNELIKSNPNYGVIVCKCEQITKQEILNCFDSLLPPTSLKGLKKRCRVLTGGCQGSVCESKLVEILLDQSIHHHKHEVIIDNLDTIVVKERH